MVLEATVLIIDNSEWSRNGDFTPNRFQAQIDAVHFLFKMKTQNNPENTVSVISDGGETPQVLVTLTNDIGILLKGLHNLQIEGKSSFATSIQIAQLILKHRANKNQRQRIMVFAASPVSEDEKILSKLAKKLKKNNVSIDVIDICENPGNETKLQEFVSTADATGSCQFFKVTPSGRLLSESLRAMIIQNESGDMGDNEGFADDMGFGIDPNLDPELALALRMSLEEEMARQRAAEGSGQQGSAAQAGGNQTSEQAPATQTQDMAADVDIIDEEEQIRRAIQLSLESEEKPEHAEANNEELISSLIGSLPGVDVDDPSLKQAFDNLKDKKEDDSSDK